MKKVEWWVGDIWRDKVLGLCTELEVQCSSKKQAMLKMKSMNERLLPGTPDYGVVKVTMELVK